MWLIQNKCKNEPKFLSAETEACVLSSVAASWAAWVLCINVVSSEIPKVGEGQPASIELSRLSLSRRVTGVLLSGI